MTAPSPDRAGRWHLFARGALDTLPMLIAAAPFGVVYGALAIAGGMSPAAAQGMSLFVFAGSSQFVAAELIGTGASALVIVLTVFVVNLRHTLYATAMVPAMRGVPRWQRVLLGFWLTDETFATVSPHLRKSRGELVPFAFGSSVAMYLNWQAWTALGIALGQHNAALTEWGLEIAMVVAFVGIVVPYLRTAGHLVCALAAVGLAVLLRDLPHQSGLLVASLLAIAAGLAVDRATAARGAGER